MRPNGSAAPGAERSADDENGTIPKQPISDAETDAKIVYLAGLPDIAYARQNKAAAAELGLSITWLDKLVRSKKAEIVARAVGDAEGETGGQGRAIKLREPEPWPHKVDGAALLSALTSAILRYMVMEPGSAEAV